MKKIISVVLCLIFAFCLVSCGGNKENVLSAPDSDPQISTVFSFMTEKYEYSADTKEINFTITNMTENEASLSTYSFELQKNTEEGWKTVAFKGETEFAELATVLKSKDSLNDTVILSEYFYLPLSSGEYRLVKDGFYSNTFNIK